MAEPAAFHVVDSRRRAARFRAAASFHAPGQLPRPRQQHGSDGCLDGVTGKEGRQAESERIQEHGGGTSLPAERGAGVLMALFGSVAVAIVALITFRDDLRARLRQTRPAGVPLLTEATVMIASYLSAERELGRIAADADVDTLAPMLIGTAHLLFAGRATRWRPERSKRS